MSDVLQETGHCEECGRGYVSDFKPGARCAAGFGISFEYAEGGTGATPEFLAMGLIAEIMKELELSIEARNRVLTWAIAKYGTASANGGE